MMTAGDAADASQPAHTAHTRNESAEAGLLKKSYEAAPSWKFAVSTSIWWIQQSKRPNFVHIGRLCRLSAGGCGNWLCGSPVEHLGNHARKVFFSTEEVEVRIHNMVVDTTRPPAGAETGCVGLQLSI